MMTSRSELAGGSHLFKITGYSVLQEVDTGKYISSSTFMIGGHEFYIDLYPQGNEEKNEEFISLYLVLNSDDKDLPVQFDFGLVDMTGKSSILGEKTSQSCTFAFKNHFWGFGRFIKRDDLEGSQYLQDNCFVVKCTVRVVKSTIQENPEIDRDEIPPSNLHLNFRTLLESGEMTDVTFDVDGEKFEAHNLVLSARSSVFKDLLSQRKEEEKGIGILIEDMKSSSFKALLHYIYTDEVPSTVDDTNAEELLQAGDRYEIERLKVICEKKVRDNISIDNVVSNLVLAEKCNCDKLKSACLEFASKPENLIALMQTKDDNNEAGLSELLKKLSHTV